MIWLRFSKASSFDKHERTTEGFVVTFVLGRLVLDWFVTWRRSQT